MTRQRGNECHDAAPDQRLSAGQSELSYPAGDESAAQAIKFLETEKKVARLDAYGLASAAMDCRVGAISATEKNVHCIVPKSLWDKPGPIARRTSVWRSKTRRIGLSR